MDQRKVALEQYLQHMLSLPMEDTTDISEFLCSNVVDSNVYQSAGQKREGYLTKRGKNFGGWKTRYFVLNEAVLEYYESVSNIQNDSLQKKLNPPPFWGETSYRKKELNWAQFV